jgi:hypothetical protein
VAPEARVVSRAAFAALAVVAAVGLLARSAAPVAQACSCYEVTLEQRVHQSGAIVLAKMVGVSATPIDVIHTDYDGILEVERYLKGSGPLQLTATDAIGGGDCGWIGPHAVGTSYVFFVHELRGETFGTGACSGTFAVSGEWARPERLRAVESLTDSRGSYAFLVALGVGSLGYIAWRMLARRRAP